MNAMAKSKSDSKADRKAQTERDKWEHDRNDNSHGVMGRGQPKEKAK
jgi:hypothetical protein